MDIRYNWVDGIIKPSFAPPNSRHDSVWTVLYFIIAFSFVFVFQEVRRRELPKIIALPFVLNLVFNFLFNFLQINLGSGVLASVDMVLVLITLIWAMIAIYPRIRWVALVNIPYLAWILFATTVQIYITYLNK